MDIFVKSPTPRDLGYIRQSERVELIALKFHFLSDVALS